MFQLHKFVKCFIKPFHVRYSVNSPKKSTKKYSFIRQTLDQKNSPTTNDWHELREKLLHNLPKGSSANVDGTILENCLPNQLNNGKSYMDYLRKSDQKLRVDTLAIFLKLFYSASKHGTEITPKDQQEIIAMSQHLLEKCSVFNATLGSAIIQGLVLTTDWRKSVDVLDSINIYSKPQMIAYSVIIQRAIKEEDEHLVWKLLTAMAADCDVLDNDVFIAHIDQCKKNESSLTANFNRMLTFIGDNQIVVSTKVAEEFQRAFHRFNHSCNVTTVSNEGKCQSCLRGLRGITITDDEFNSLLNHFSDKALILIKSTPAELESFKSFIDKTMPYDYVIDGLNTSLLQTLQQQHSPNAAQAHASLKSFQLASVVKHLVDRKKSVLVIGRKHMMEDWPKAQVDYLQNNAHLFLAENLSKDDPFFLYSALKSGPNTNFVTRDLLRDHALKLDDKLKTVFRRWQQRHQCMVESISDSGLVEWENRIENNIENRMDFDMNAQQVDEDCWHIPYGNSSHCMVQYCELRKHWLCVSKKN